jgi:hypothetical protein
MSGDWKRCSKRRNRKKGRRHKRRPFLLVFTPRTAAAIKIVKRLV